MGHNGGVAAYTRTWELQPSFLAAQIATNVLYAQGASSQTAESWVLFVGMTPTGIMV